MGLKKLFMRISSIIYNYILINTSRTGFGFIILLTGITFMITVRNSTPLFIYSILFTVLLLLSNYWKGSLTSKYIFSVIAFAIFSASVQFYNIELSHFGRFAYYIPLIYSYLLPDIITPNIIGIMTSFLFSTYIGTADFNQVLSGIIGIVYVSATCSITFHLLRKLTVERDKYYEISITDSLTGLSTLKNFVEKGQEILNKASESAVLLIDLNHFKQINDTYGHLEGNKVLIEFSDFLKREMMDTNCILGRLGGDQFVVFLYDLPYNRVEKKVQQLYLSFSNKVFYEDSVHPSFKMYLSVGKAYSNQYKKQTLEELLNQADRNMHFNKYGVYKLPYNSELNNVKLSDKTKRLLRTLEEKDMYTYIHSKFTAQYAAELAAAFGLHEKKVEDIYMSGLVHDIGMLYIPNDILRKPERLESEEYTVIKEHVNDGLNLLKGMQLSETILNGIKYHHEKFDGTGYPNEIRGCDTPVEGRIIQIADAFSAMTIKRVYREISSLDEALLELRKNSSSQFDPELVDIFIELFKEKRTAV
jgi:diguanylate cyclase (GGDEF)-like protein/putative nucleotidyltransferase with HDIG domain